MPYKKTLETVLEAQIGDSLQDNPLVYWAFAVEKGLMAVTVHKTLPVINISDLNIEKSLPLGFEPDFMAYNGSADAFFIAGRDGSRSIIRADAVDKGVNEVNLVARLDGIRGNSSLIFRDFGQRLIGVTYFNQGVSPTGRDEPHLMLLANYQGGVNIKWLPLPNLPEREKGDDSYPVDLVTDERNNRAYVLNARSARVNVCDFSGEGPAFRTFRVGNGLGNTRGAVNPVDSSLWVANGQYLVKVPYSEASGEREVDVGKLSSFKIGYDQMDQVGNLAFNGGGSLIAASLPNSGRIVLRHLSNGRLNYVDFKRQSLVHFVGDTLYVLSRNNRSIAAFEKVV